MQKSRTDPLKGGRSAGLQTASMFLRSELQHFSTALHRTAMEPREKTGTDDVFSVDRALMGDPFTAARASRASNRLSLTTISCYKHLRQASPYGLIRVVATPYKSFWYRENNKLLISAVGKQPLHDALANFEDVRNQCFLCARHLSLHGQTDEHVVPQWAQRRYDLWNQRIHLLNGTALPYRQLTVPCCEECNKYRLAPLEDSMSQTVESGRDSVLSLGSKLLFLWLGKIFYGILYRELMLLTDRSDPTLGTIASPELLQRFRMHRYFLQQARGLVQLQNFEPGSIFVFNAQRLPAPRMEWDLVDNVNSLFISVRVGRVALFASLGDGGAQQFEEEIYEEFFGLDLHPLQIRELCARFCYRSLSSTRTPKYISADGLPDQTWQMPLAGLSSKPLFLAFDPDTYGQILSYFTGYPLDVVFQPPKLMTWLRDDNGNVRHMPFNDFPAIPPGPSAIME